jgi:D-alanine-D-alanine ligase
VPIKTEEPDALHIAVLMGGLSAERNVSLSSGNAVATALRDLGYQVDALDADASIAQTLQTLKPDVVFNALHGRFGEDGCVQGICEWLRIPYTHSGVLASALAMHKPTAKRIFAAAGLRCAEGGIFSAVQMRAGDVMARPYVIKPINEGSSVGVTITMTAMPCQRTSPTKPWWSAILQGAKFRWLCLAANRWERLKSSAESFL